MPDQKQAAPAQETLMYGTARLVTLGSDVPSASKVSGVKRNGAEISINIVVSLGGDKYVTSTLGGDIAAALTGKLRTISGEGRVAFTEAWISAVKTAVYDAYDLAASREPGLASVTYAVPSFNAVKVDAEPNEFRPASLAMPLIPAKAGPARDTLTAKEGPISVPRPSVVSGTGTKEDPFLVQFPDVIGTDDARGCAAVSLAPEMHFADDKTSYDKTIYFRITLQAAHFADRRFDSTSESASGLIATKVWSFFKDEGVSPMAARDFLTYARQEIQKMLRVEKANLETEGLTQYMRAN